MLSLVWNAIEAGLSLLFGIMSHTLTVEAFGLDSAIEIASALLVVWWLWKHHDRSGTSKVDGCRSLWRERVASGMIGAMLLGLGLTAIGFGFAALIKQKAPEKSWGSMSITAASVVIMTILFLFKRYASRVLDSSTLRADAMCSLSCMLLSSMTLFSVALYSIDERLWWIDGCTVTLAGFLIGQEGWSTLKNCFSADFSGGCCG